MSQRRNQTPYNVGFLDDLHRYFPDILYNPQRFTNVQDILGYIQENTRNQFDLYSRGLREFQAESRRRNWGEPITPPPQAVRSSSAATNRPVSPPPPVSAPTEGIPGEPMRPVRRARRSEETNINQHHPDTNAHIEATAAMLYDDDETGLSSQLIDILNRVERGNRAFPLSFFSNLFPSTRRVVTRGGLGTVEIRTNDILPENFLEPVLIRPTAQQIQDASRVDTLAVGSSDICAICQDSFAAHSNRRTLTVCAHAFHMNCIDTWFEQNVHCPVCRHDIRDLSVE